MDLVVLAIDPGRKTGWACSDGTSGSVRFSQETHGAVGWRWASWFGDLLDETGAGLVIIERQVSGKGFTGFAGRQIMLGLRMIALAGCHGHDRACHEVSTATWKAWARRHMPEWTKGDENDARAMLAYAMAEIVPTVIDA